ncbi:MAG: Hsp20/alpha crystallin family protein [Chlorobiaceae bacterium]|nr:Hsp20/alpha crystallin family protein [Chlorobiaceae bacterium]
MLVKLTKDPLRKFDDIRSSAKTPSMPAFYVDISEDETGFHIDAELPGIAKDEIALNVEDDVLTIKAERKHNTEENKKDYLRIERTYGSLQRKFSLGETIDQEHINAGFDNGILHVTLPKAQMTKKIKEIAIN